MRVYPCRCFKKVLLIEEDRICCTQNMKVSFLKRNNKIDDNGGTLLPYPGQTRFAGGMKINHIASRNGFVRHDKSPSQN